MLITKIVSSMDKCFLDGNIYELREVSRFSTLKNERLSLQLAYSETTTWANHRRLLKLRVEGALAPYVRVRKVQSVPVAMPVYPNRYDENYLRTTPGMYPDLLLPLSYDDSIVVSAGQLHAVWLDVCPDGELPVGDHELTLVLTEGESVVTSQRATVHVIDATLPDHGIRVTQWFHTDCLAQYYRVEVFSARYWEIVESFARTAVKNGINTLLTPIFTPPLDTRVGGERLTVQLVGVERTSGAYSFDFSRLDRWIDMCDRVGVKYLEMAHLFTQWGAAHAPKVMATVDGEYRRLFGWDTDATGEEYPAFLRAFIPSLLAHLKARGDDGRCIFHISDEPNEHHLEQYRASKAIVSELLSDYLCIDALSNVEFYRQGVVEHPVPASNHIEDFIKAGVPDLWTYYCCTQCQGNVSNRFIAMPGARTRCIGMQLFKYDIVGFLQWGYNFYNNQFSYDTVNPFLDTCGDYFAPGGDCFSVYPAPDGTPYESMRILQFADALSDLAAMRLASSLCGKEAVVAEAERVAGEIRFNRSLSSSADMLAVREAINAMIERALA